MTAGADRAPYLIGQAPGHDAGASAAIV